MLYQKSLSLLLFFLLEISFLHAQKTNSYWEADYAYGSVFVHNNSLGHLATSHPEFTSIAWLNSAPKSTWKQHYNYPDWGLTLLHQRFKNPILGNVTAVNYTNKFYLLNRNNTNQINLGMGLGIGYSTKPLDFETNHQNVAISAPFSFSVHLKVNYERLLYRNLGFSSGILFTHFSNSGYKKPNSGINSVFLNAGLSYHPVLQEKDFYPKREPVEKMGKHPLLLQLILEGSVHELKARLGAKPILVLGVSAHKRITQKSGLLLGAEYFHSWANKDFADFLYHTQTEYIDRVLKDYKQVGIFVGHDLFFNRWIFDATVGYYLYNPLGETPRFYEKLGSKYRIPDSKFSVGFAIKVHGFRANYTSLGIHYQIL